MSKPGVKPLTMPVVFMVATEVLVMPHVPVVDVSEKVIAEPAHTLLTPVIAPTTGAEQVVVPFIERLSICRCPPVALALKPYILKVKVDVVLNEVLQFAVTTVPQLAFRGEKSVPGSTHVEPPVML